MREAVVAGEAAAASVLPVATGASPESVYASVTPSVLTNVPAVPIRRPSRG